MEPQPNPTLPPTSTLTTHTPSGTSTLLPSLPVTFTPINKESTIFQANIYTTHTFPTLLTNNDDITRHENWVPGGGIGVKDGTLVVLNKFLPGAVCPAHRTETIDFGVVVEGGIEVEMEDGEKRGFKKGDVVVQRGTWHAWRNVSEEEEALVFWVAVAARAVEVGGEVKGEDLSNFQ